MRILLISHFFPPKHNAGTENYTLGIAKALQKRGHSVQVLCAEDWGTGDSYWNGVTEDSYQGVPVKRIHLNWVMAADPNLVLYDSKPMEIWMSQFLKVEMFDVVHITSTYSLGIGVMRSVKAAEIPLVLTLMDFWFLCPSTQLLKSNGESCDGITTALQCQSCLMGTSGVSRWLSGVGMPDIFQTQMWGLLAHLPQLTKKRGFRGKLLNMSERKKLLKEAIEMPDLVFSHSKTVQEMFSKHTKREIKILRNGHELSWLKTYHGKTPSDKLRIGYMGQITLIKGVHILVEAFKRANFNGQVKLDIWGNLEKDRNYVDQLKALILDDSSIFLCGRFEHDDLANILSNIDVLVVPSIWYENAPLVIQEAFAAKTPVVATRLGGMAEAVSHNVDGLLFEAGNVADLAEKLRSFIEDPGLLKGLVSGIAAVKQVDQEVIELEENYLRFTDYKILQKT